MTHCPDTNRRLLVVGCLKGRDPRDMLSALRADEFDRVFVCTAPTPRGLPADELAEAARTIGCDDVIVVDHVERAIDLALTDAMADDAVFGLVSLADAERYQIPTASLLSHTDRLAATAFTDSKGRTFVAPTQASLRAAAKLLAPDPALGTWVLPYASTLRGAAGAAAYPGTMLVTLAAPAKGLPSADAVKLGTTMRIMAQNLQAPGFGVGQLPPGYLPLTAANGLGALVHYSQVAADQVAGQTGVVPRLDGTVPGPTAAPSPTNPAPSPLPTTGNSSPEPSSSTPPPSPSPTPSASASATSVPLVPTAATRPVAVSPWASSIPVLLAVALVSGLAAAATVLWRRP